MGYYGELQGGELYNKEKNDMTVKQNTGRVGAYTAKEYIFNESALVEAYRQKIRGGVLEKEQNNTNVIDALSSALKRVSECEGIVGISEYGVELNGLAADDYLLMYLLADMLKKGECEFKIKSSKYDYFCKLLHIKEKEYCGTKNDLHR